MRNDHLILEACKKPGFRERFFKKVRCVGECIEWIGNRKPEKSNNYGIIAVAPGRLGRTHRVAWALKHGTLPDCLLMHTCDNPPCIRLSHLRPGTPKDNGADMARKGRANGGPPPGERNGNVKLTEKQALDIFTRRRNGEGPVALGREFGISRQQVYLIALGKQWPHLHHPS